MGSDSYGTRHAEIEELLGAYALDAVPEDERRAVEEHLAECSVCRTEIEEHRATASMLAATASPAPAELWERIAEAIEPARPVDLASARAARRGPGAALRWVAAAAAVVAIAGLGIKVVDQGRALDRLEATGEQQELEQAASAALLDPGASRVELASESDGAAVEAVVLPDGRGYLVRNNLPALPAGRTYQLWALGEGAPISVGVLGRRPRVVAFSVDPGVAGLAITEERGGGVVSTENDPLVVGELRTA